MRTVITLDRRICNVCIFFQPILSFDCLKTDTWWGVCYEASLLALPRHVWRRGGLRVVMAGQLFFSEPVCWSERLERGGPCWLLKPLLKLRGVFSWLVRWACRAITRDFCSALAALDGPVPNIFFLAVHYFNSFAPSPRPASWAGSCAGSPVS